MISGLFAGSARRKLTPDRAVDLSGYGMREQPMTGVRDEILARSLFIRSGGEMAVICCLDLLSLDFEQVEYIRERTTRSLGLARDRLLLACSHTHGGPAMQHLRLCGTPTPSYVQWALDQIVETILASATDLRPVSAVVAGQAQCDLAINRRQRTVGGVQIGHNPEGELDRTLVAMQLSGEDGRAIATVFNYACHGVVLGGDNRQISADWPGEACRMVEARSGGEAMFIQGCCGDVNPRIRGGFDEVAKAAGLAAASIELALSSGRSLSSFEISSGMNTVSLPLQQLPADADLQKIVDAVQQKPESDWSFVEQRDYLWASGAISNPDRSRCSAMDVPTGYLKLGDLLMAWIPAEAFGSFALELRQRRLGRPTMVGGYCNGNIGYLPTKEAFSEGGYEVTEAYRYYGYQMMTDEAESLVKRSFASAL